MDELNIAGKIRRTGLAGPAATVARP
jgi:hypothetical protein